MLRVIVQGTPLSARTACEPEIGGTGSSTTPVGRVPPGDRRRQNPRIGPYQSLPLTERKGRGSSLSIVVPEEGSYDQRINLK